MKAMGRTASSYNLDHSGVTGGGVIPRRGLKIRGTLSPPVLPSYPSNMKRQEVFLFSSPFLLVVKDMSIIAILLRICYFFVILLLGHLLISQVPFKEFLLRFGNNG